MKAILNYIRKNKLLLLVIIPAFLVHMIVILPNGSYYCFQEKCGLFFWRAHGHDAIWHFALINVAFKHFPFIVPTFTGAILGGYNFFLDLVLYGLSKVGIPAMVSYFKIMPLVWFVLMTWVTINLARRLKDSASFVAIFLFFMFFSGSFTYFLTLYHNNTIWDSSRLLTMQTVLNLTNLQFSFSLVVLVVILTMIHKKSKNIILLSILVGLNFALKFYGGAVSIFLVAIYLLGEFIRERNVFIFIKSGLVLFVVSVVSVLVFYNPLQSLESGPALSFVPFATIQPVIEERELFYLKDMVNARYFLMEAVAKTHKLSPRLIYIQAVTLLIFLFLNLGTRIIGLIYFAKQCITKKVSSFDVYVLSTSIFALTLTVLFVQKGIWWNTIQFFYYTLFLLNIFAAQALYAVVKKRSLIRIIIGVAIVILTLPTAIDLTRQSFSFPAPAYVSQEELKALEFLKKQPDGVVYAPIDAKLDRENYEYPFPMPAFDDTSYVSAFSHKQTYAADAVQLQLLGIPYETRYEKMKNGDCEILKEIKYIYTVKNDRDESWKKCLQNKDLKIEKIYGDGPIGIYKRA